MVQCFNLQARSCFPAACAGVNGHFTTVAAFSRPSRKLGYNGAMNIAFNTAVNGMLQAQSAFSTASRNVVESASRGEDIIDAMVAVKKAESIHAASATMVKASSEMTDTLLDITV